MIASLLLYLLAFAQKPWLGSAEQVDGFARAVPLGRGWLGGMLYEISFS